VKTFFFMLSFINIDGKSKITNLSQLKPEGSVEIFNQTPSKPFTAEVKIQPASFRCELWSVPLNGTTQLSNTQIINPGSGTGSQRPPNTSFMLKATFTGRQTHRTEEVVSINLTPSEPGRSASINTVWIKLIANAGVINRNDLKIIFINADPSGSEVNNEVIWIANDTNMPLDLGGCVVTHNSGIQQTPKAFFTFPEGFQLGQKHPWTFIDPIANQQLISSAQFVCSLFTGENHSIHNIPNVFYGGLKQAIWNNSGDTARVFNSPDSVIGALVCQSIPRENFPQSRITRPPGQDPAQDAIDQAVRDAFSEAQADAHHGSTWSEGILTSLGAEICSINYGSGQNITPSPSGVPTPTPVPPTVTVISDTDINSIFHKPGSPTTQIVTLGALFPKNPPNWTGDDIWMPTGIFPQTDDFVDFTATGSIDAQNFRHNGPDGLNNFAGGDTLAAGPENTLSGLWHWPLEGTSQSNKYSLIGRIGENGIPFLIGSNLHHRVTVEVPRNRQQNEIFLTLNDYRSFNDPLNIVITADRSFLCDIKVSRN
jgi:hypothetical protein